jgi:hypothetical protein
LIIFLTPHVIRSRGDLSEISADRQERFEKSLETFSEMPADQYRDESDQEERQRDEKPGPRDRFPGWPTIEKDEF